MINQILTAITLALLIAFLSGCASMFSAKTEATYQIAPDGTRIINYSSTKEQHGMEATWKDKDGRDVHIQVDKATTAEGAQAAALQLQLETMKLLQTILPLAVQNMPK